MNRVSIDLSGLHERASATPDGTSSRPALARPSARSSAAEARDATLRGRQRWFAGAVMTAETLAIDESEAAGALTPGPRLSPLERLEIYRRGYHGRLIECLGDDYPSLRHALGERSFDDLCRVYIERFPSDGPNLNFYGRHMAAVCQTDAASSPAFCADLATLEWSIVEVIHAPSSPPLTVEGLAHVAPELWGEARLVPNTAVRLLRFDHPVNAYFQAIREGAEPATPGQEPSATVVYRSGPTIWRMELTPPMFDVLSALLAGEPLGAALGRAETGLAGLAEDQIVQRVMFWFSEWVSSGLFVRVAPG